jgi:hypothetical protein
LVFRLVGKIEVVGMLVGTPEVGRPEVGRPDDKMLVIVERNPLVVVDVTVTVLVPPEIVDVLVTVFAGLCLVLVLVF